MANQSWSTGNRLLINSIHDNLALGIDLGGEGVTANDPGDGDPGPNNLQNYPLLTGATTTAIEGTLDSVGRRTYRIELFANAACDPSGNGEGATYLGELTGPGTRVLQLRPGRRGRRRRRHHRHRDQRDDRRHLRVQRLRDRRGSAGSVRLPGRHRRRPSRPYRRPTCGSTGRHRPAPTFQSDECIFLFEEQQDVALPATSCRSPRGRRAWPRSGSETVLLVEDRVVSSYLLHTDAADERAATCGARGHSTSGSWACSSARTTSTSPTRWSASSARAGSPTRRTTPPEGWSSTRPTR